ncbi:vacuole protein, partial [Rhizoctonia solani AG-3 Rhs1AP]
MASTSTPLLASERTPFAALPLSRFYAASDCGPVLSSAKKPSLTPGSASLKHRLSPMTFASPSKKRATNDNKPSTPGEFAVPRPPKAVSKCLFEDVEMDADDSGFGASPAMQMNYEPSLASTSYLAPPLLVDRFPAHSSPSSTPKIRGPDAPVLAPSPEIVSGSNTSRNSASRWVASKTRDSEAHHPGFDIYCDPIGYDASVMSSPMSWEYDSAVPELVFDSPKENDAPARKAKRMPVPLSLFKDSVGSSPLSTTPKRPSRLATSTNIESPWSRMQLGDSTGVNLSSSPAA